jgi:hypothetical protein
MNRLRSWSNTSLDDLPPDVHHIIDVCDMIEKRFEETQQTNFNSAFNREDSMAMDVDINPVPIQSQFFCQRKKKPNYFNFVFVE